MSNTHYLKHEQKALALDPTIAPVLQAKPGDTIHFETADMAYRRLHAGETVEAIGLENFNAVTGPVFIEGAEPGDALKVKVIDVQVRSAWSVWLPEFGGLGKRTDKIHTQEIKLEDGLAHISDRIKIPLETMIGCIAVAPSEGIGSTFMPAYPYGGNMDLREMSPGATIYLPIQVPGALLSVGDLHAAMGQGEPTWVSLEAAGTAILTVDIVKNLPLKFPRLELENNILCMGMGESLEEAHQVALEQAFEVLINEFQLEAFEAYAYASAKVSMSLGGPGSPMVLAKFPKPNIA